MPQRSRTARKSRLEARLPAAAHALIRRAAELQGRSVSDFVITAAQDAAKQTITDTEILRLSLEDQRRFADALLTPPPPSPALRRALKRHQSLLGGR